MSDPGADPLSLAKAVARHDRVALGRAITLVESDRQEHRTRAAEMLAALPAPTASTYRIGISGLPGSGKSTFVNRVGLSLVEAGHRVAVLAVDPTSVVSGGSILGDKTRMTQLGRSEDAFIRPSPTRGHLGGVAEKTSAVIRLVEAAGFDVTLVETVGVGQSETEVSNIVDATVLLLLAGGGDGLQGIKRGVLEIADVVAINKADGANVDSANAASRELASALRLMRGPHAPMVHSCSALEGQGVSEVIDSALSGIRAEQESGELQKRRGEQRVRRLWAELDREMRAKLRDEALRNGGWEATEAAVRLGEKTPAQGALDLIAQLRSRPQG